MLVNFIDSYQPSIDAGYSLVANIHLKIANKEAMTGGTKMLDKLYAQAAVIMGIIDLLENEDNENPMGNETFLNELNYLINSKLC
jgi:hypothetical protein